MGKCSISDFEWECDVFLPTAVWKLCYFELLKDPVTFYNPLGDWEQASSPRQALRFLRAQYLEKEKPENILQLLLKTLKS